MPVYTFGEGAAWAGDFADLQSAVGKTTGMHIRPRSNSPHASFTDACWVVIKAKKVNQMTALARQDYDALSTEAGDTFKFLAPNDIQENIGHTWEEYESVTSRLANKIAGASKLVAGVKQTANAIKKVYASEQAAVSDLMRGVAQSMSGQVVHHRKIDAGMTYTNSERRNWTLDFVLVDEGNPKSDIIDVVDLLKIYSCADRREGSLINFTLPYIFEVYTEPEKFIHLRSAALIAVQPTYKGPYRGGYPSMCELQLNFLDLAPLYAKTFKSTEVITVGSTVDAVTSVAKVGAKDTIQSVADKAQTAIDDYKNRFPGVVTSVTGKITDAARDKAKQLTSKAYTDISTTLRRGATQAISEAIEPISKRALSGVTGKAWNQIQQQLQSGTYKRASTGLEPVKSSARRVSKNWAKLLSKWF